MHALLAIVSLLGRFVAREAGAFTRWVRQIALLALRAARALAVWVSAHVAARMALAAAGIAAFEALTVYLTSSVITPLATTFVHRCIPEGSAGDGLVYLLWDKGLNGAALFGAAVVYLANYTALWRAFDLWLRAEAVALSTYRAALRTAKAVRDASILR